MENLIHIEKITLNAKFAEPYAFPYSLSTAAVLTEISPPPLHSSEYQGDGDTEIRNNIKYQSRGPAAQTLSAHVRLLLPPHPDSTHPAPFRVQVGDVHSAGNALSFAILTDSPHIPSAAPLQENTDHISYSRRCLRVAAGSVLQNREASGSGDGDQLSRRRLDRTVFMAAAGRDVSLAPSIQLPSDGFSPCFIIIPIISLGGGSRRPPSCPRCSPHSPFLASDAI